MDENPSSSHCSPIFILGMNGSGTTLLADCLGRHSDLFSIPYETKVIPYFLANMRRFGDLRSVGARRKLALDIGATKAFWLANGRRNIVLENGALKESSFAGVVDALFQHLAHARSAPRKIPPVASESGNFAVVAGERAQATDRVRWVEKSPQNLGSVSEIAEAFPDAQFVHIIRDGRDCAQSLHRRWRFDPVVSIYRWRQLVGRGRKAGMWMGPERYLEIRYEDLTIDPETTLTAVCKFLHLSFQVEMLNTKVQTANVDISNAETIVANSERWRRYFSPTIVDLMERVAGEFLGELGYPVTVHGNSKPSVWRWQYSKIRSRATAAVRRIRSHGWVAFPALWRALRVSRMQDSVDRSR